MSEQRKAVIKNADMGDQMQQDAVDIASKALSEYNIEKVRVGVDICQCCRVAGWLMLSRRMEIGLNYAGLQWTKARASIESTAFSEAPGVRIASELTLFSLLIESC